MDCTKTRKKLVIVMELQAFLMARLEGKVAIITGAAQCMGASTYPFKTSCFTRKSNKYGSLPSLKECEILYFN